MPAVDGVGAREVDPVVGSGEGFGEPVFGLFEPVTRFLEERVAGLQALVDLLDGVELTQAVLHGVGQVAVLPRQYQQVVLLLLVVEEVLQFAGRHLPVRLDDDEGTRAAQANLVKARQHLHVLVGLAPVRLEDAGEPVDQRLVDLGLRHLLGVALDLAREVLGLLDEEALVLAVQVPGLLTQPLQGLQEFVGLAARSGEEFDDLAL